MGLVSGETGRGTFVKEPLPRAQVNDLAAWSADTVDLSFNYPSLPDQTDLFRAALRQLAAAGDLESMLRYQPHGGREHERATGAHHLASQGLSATAETTVLVSGAQHGLTTTAMALFEPGDVVAVDALTYPDSNWPPRPITWNSLRSPLQEAARIWTRWRRSANGDECALSTRCRHCIIRSAG
jgi:DNA-binding transcriptional MocR family regulator